MADGTFDKDLDMLMKLALLNGILDKDKKAEAIPFAVEVVCTPSNILCRCSGNKKMLEDIEGADEWFEETSMSGQKVGQLYMANNTGLHALIGGGHWRDGVHDGSRTVACSSSPWGVSARVGVWCVCDSL